MTSQALYEPAPLVEHALQHNQSGRTFKRTQIECKFELSKSRVFNENFQALGANTRTCSIEFA
jgi:hypothetical protein